MSTDAPKLYSMTESSALAVEIALRWAGADYELEMRVPERSEEPAFRAANPEAQVPAMLLRGESVLTEAHALLLLVADSHPESELAPPSSQPMARFRLEELLAFMTGEVHFAFESVTSRSPDTDTASVVDQASALRRLGRLLDRLERRVGTKAFVLDRRSVADAYLYVVARWASRISPGLTVPNLVRYRSAMERDPDVGASLAAQAMQPL